MLADGGPIAGAGVDERDLAEDAHSHVIDGEVTDRDRLRGLFEKGRLVDQRAVRVRAEKIVGENICVLSAGSDGLDGNSPAAGAIVDGCTLDKAKARGLDLKSHLQAFNAYPLLEELGDAITIGPTGNNLRDLRILLAA